jgi:hypothetical protein
MIKKAILAMFAISAVVNASTLDVGLLAHYTFDGNANDIGNSGNNLQVNGSSQFISAGHNGGQALRTNGDRSVFSSGGGYIVANFMQNIARPAATFNFWTRNEQTGSPYAPAHSQEAYLEIGYGDAPPYINIGVNALGDSGQIGVGHQLMNGVWQGSVSPTVNWADWKMITLSVTSGEYVAYLNGVEFDRRALDGSLFPSSNVRLGSTTWWSGGGSSSRMDVEWDDMRIYERALSSAEVSTLYTLESVPEPSALSLLAVGLCELAILRRRRS